MRTCDPMWRMVRYVLLLVFCLSLPASYRTVVAGTPLTGTFPRDPLELRSPGRLAVSETGTVYVVDGHRNRVKVFDVQGNHIGTIPCDLPSAVAIAPDGSVYIGSHRDYSVTILRDGKRAGTLGKGSREFSSISDLAVDPITGDVYVADAVANAIRVYNGSGAPIAAFGGFHSPAGVAVNDQAVYVLDAPATKADGSVSTGSRISLLSKDGTPLGSFWHPAASGVVIARPIDLAVDRSGMIYVADTALDDVKLYAGTGALRGSIKSESGGLGRPVSVALSPDGTLYISSSKTGSIVRIGPGAAASIDAPAHEED